MILTLILSSWLSVLRCALATLRVLRLDIERLELEE